MSELKDVPGYEGLYGVTRDGRVWDYILKRFLNFITDSREYCCIWLYKINGTRKNYLIHRLVVVTWGDLDLNNPSTVAHHINGIKSDNRLDNLCVIDICEHQRSHKKGYGRNTETHKLCTKCEKLKLRSEFNENLRKLDGLRSWCRSCMNAYYQQNKIQILQKLKEKRQYV